MSKAKRWLGCWPSGCSSNATRPCRSACGGCSRTSTSAAAKSRRAGSARCPRRCGGSSATVCSGAREEEAVKVYIIGAGPGDPGLITVKGAQLVARCPVVLYTGSLVPPEIVASARPGAKVLDSSGMTLDEIVALMVEARDAGEDVARGHTGDPMLFGATAEQMRRLDELGIPWEIVPGVSSFTAAAAALGRELTLPELSQTVILTRAEGRTPMPPKERLEDLAQHGATLA